MIFYMFHNAECFTHAGHHDDFLHDVSHLEEGKRGVPPMLVKINATPKLT